jgi:hypothetical protein
MRTHLFGSLFRWCGLLLPLVSGCTSPEISWPLAQPAHSTLAGRWRQDSTRTRLYDAPGHLAASSSDRLDGRWVNLDTTAWVSAGGEASPVSRHADTLRVVHTYRSEYASGKPQVEKYVVTALNNNRLVLRNTATDATVNGPLVWVIEYYYSR